ncbi:hypothetical protein ACHAXR_013432 [Thalassiosira sp. AJA248-18]
MKRKLNHSHPVIVFGLASFVANCKSLSIDLPTLAQHRHHGKIQHPCRHSQAIRYKSYRTFHSVKPDSSEDFDGEEPQNESLQSSKSSTSLQEKLGHSFSVLQTAIAAFCAGSFLTVLSFFFFGYSFWGNDHASVYQDVSATKSVASARYFDETIPADPIQQKRKAVALYKTILEQLDQGYVHDVEPMILFETTTRAMLSTLDPYTEYISPDDMAKRQQLVGIGAFVMKAGNTPEFLDGKSVSTIMSLVPSEITLPTQLLPSEDNDMTSENAKFRVVLSLAGYAYDAGLRVGDEILEIDDQPVVGSLEGVREMLMGVPGTKVKLAFKRPGINKVQTIDVERKIVQFPNVPYAGILSNGSTISTKSAVSTESSGDIGYIRLRRFGIDAGISMKKAINSIQSDRMKGLILDLRDNSGGELLSAVQIASLFFPEGTYLGSSEGKGSLYPNESYHAGKSDLAQYGSASSDNNSKSRNGFAPNGDSSIYLDGKQVINPDNTNIVILTNQRTASASEFLAGVFQDLDKGVIIGSDESTLGKGIGQREIRLPYGSGLKLTYAKFYTPSGRCVQREQKEGINGRGKQDQSQKVFHTKNGRTVNDGKGIEVDYKSYPKTSRLSSLLSSSGAYFEFATEFCSKHQWPSIDPDFAVDDTIYNDFKSFVLKEQRMGNLNLDDVFDDQHLLKRIKTISVETNQHDSSLIQNSVANLRGKIVRDLLKDFDYCEDIIRNELEQNIIARQLPDSELIGRGLKSDELVKEAVRILEDTDKYRQLLHVPN